MRIAPCAVLIGLLALPSAAQTNLSLMTTPWRAPSPTDAGGDFTFLPTETDGPGAPDLDLSIFRVAGRYRPDPDAENRLAFGYEFFRLGLDTSDPVLPDDLTNAALAVGARLGEFVAFEHQWNWGGSVGVGFAADNNFGDSNGWYALGSLFANTRLTDTRSLMVGIDFDGNRAIFPDLPLPAFAYTVRYSDTLTYTLGFPVSFINWSPNDQLTLSASVAGLAFGAQARYQLSDTLTLLATYGGNGEAFHTSGGSGDRRLFYSAQYVEAGVELAFTDTASVVVAGGFAFDQEFETGFDVRDTTNVRDLDDTGYVRVGGVLRF